MDNLEEIRSRLSIVDVVSRYITLKKVGKNYRGLCPFHNDTKPSFIVSPEKNFGWCFACQNGGDVFGFVQKIENISFRESIPLLAEWAGVIIKDENPKTAQKKEEKERLQEIINLAQEFFITQLKNNNKASNYLLEKRKISPIIIEKFGIGYAPKGFHNLEKYLLSQGVSHKELLDTGLSTTKDQNAQETYDKFRDRIMFPFHDLQGRIKGFGGRVIDEGEPKYLNSPETKLYEKSKILYGLHFAKESIKKSDFSLLVEGNIDVIACHQGGFTQAIASSGVGFSETQALLLKRFSSNVIIAFDQDNAGKQATLRTIETFWKTDMNPKVLQIEGGKDPDEIISKSPKAFEDGVKNPTTAIDFLIQFHLKEPHKLSASEKKEKYQEIFEPISNIQNALELQEALEKIATAIKIDNALLEREFNKYKEKKPIQKNEESPLQKIQIHRSQYFWGFFLSFPNLIPLLLQKFTLDFFQNQQEKGLFSTLKSEYNPKCNVFELLTHFPEENLAQWKSAALYAEEQHLHTSKPNLEKEAILLIEDQGLQLLKDAIKNAPSDQKLKFFELLKAFHK